jgi:hypothetical protein
MITWFGWIGHLGQGLLMEHYSFESQWCDLGLPKEGRSGEEEEDFFLGHTFLKKENCKYLLVEKLFFFG